jgi:predicted Zn finger-like uncharacterized protein
VLTRCPACATTFRVTAEQIKLRAGRVRCGQCQHAFNALDTLIEEFIPTLSEPPEPDTGPISAPAAMEPAVPPAPTFFAPEEKPLEEEPPVDASTIESTDAATEEEKQAPEETHEELADGSEKTATANILLDEIPAWPDDTATNTLSRRWPWLAGGLLLLAMLGIQIAIALRVELAVLYPGARPALVSLCSIAGCKVGLPAKAELIGIEASDLHPDPAQPGRLIVSATLKNRAPFDQQFPHLELTLTDVADKAVARKVIAPADYLPPETLRAKGMRPNADITVNLTIDIGQLTANGYRLYLFYP